MTAKGKGVKAWVKIRKHQLLVLKLYVDTGQKNLSLTDACKIKVLTDFRSQERLAKSSSMLLTFIQGWILIEGFAPVRSVCDWLGM